MTALTQAQKTELGLRNYTEKWWNNLTFKNRRYQTYWYYDPDFVPKWVCDGNKEYSFEWSAGVDLAMDPSVEARRFVFSQWTADQIWNLDLSLARIEEKEPFPIRKTRIGKTCDTDRAALEGNIKSYYHISNAGWDTAIRIRDHLPGARRNLMLEAPIYLWQKGSATEKNIIIRHFNIRLNAANLSVSDIIQIYDEAIKNLSLKAHQNPISHYSSLFYKNTYTRSLVTVIDNIQAAALKIVEDNPNDGDIVEMLFQSDVFSRTHLDCGVSGRRTGVFISLLSAPQLMRYFSAAIGSLGSVWRYSAVQKEITESIQSRAVSLVRDMESAGKLELLNQLIGNGLFQRTHCHRGITSAYTNHIEAEKSRLEATPEAEAVAVDAPDNSRVSPGLSILSCQTPSAPPLFRVKRTVV